MLGPAPPVGKGRSHLRKRRTKFAVFSFLSQIGPGPIKSARPGCFLSKTIATKRLDHKAESKHVHVGQTDLKRWFPGWRIVARDFRQIDFVVFDIDGDCCC